MVRICGLQLAVVALGEGLVSLSLNFDEWSYSFFPFGTKDDSAARKMRLGSTY